MKIGVDCRLSGPKHAGIGRYITELISRLVDNQNHHWVLFFYDIEQARVVLPKPAFSASNIKIIIKPVKHYSVSEQLKMPQAYRHEKLDLLHVPHFNIPIFYFGNIVVTIHDLLWHDQRGTTVTTLPAWQYWVKYFAYRIVAWLAIQRAKTIIVPSNTIKQELAKHYQNIDNKVRVITEGFSKKLELPDSEKGQKKISRNPNQLLFVGSLYPHKNIALVAEALKQFPNYQLVIVGARSVFSDETKKIVKRFSVENQVVFKGAVSDSELAKIYSQSGALVLPSLSEGFGLTGLEAMALKTPVLASNIPVFREIYQDGAIYFDPHSVDSFAESLNSLEKLDLKNFEIRAEAVVKQYSWKKMVEETLAIYDNLALKT